MALRACALGLAGEQKITDKLRFICSLHAVLLKNCDFYVPDDDFCRKIAIYWLPTAVFIKKSRFLSSRRRFLSKNRDLLAADGCFHQKPAVSEFLTAIFIKNLQFLSSRRLFSLKNRIFHSSEVSETSFFAFSAHPRPRKRHFSHFSLIRGLG